MSTEYQVGYQDQDDLSYKTLSMHLKVSQPIRFWKAKKLLIHLLSLAYLFIDL